MVQSILDLTYFRENELTESAFNPEMVLVQLNEILGEYGCCEASFFIGCCTPLIFNI